MYNIPYNFCSLHMNNQTRSIITEIHQLKVDV